MFSNFHFFSFFLSLSFFSFFSFFFLHFFFPLPFSSPVAASSDGCPCFLHPPMAATTLPSKPRSVTPVQRLSSSATASSLTSSVTHPLSGSFSLSVSPDVKRGGGRQWRLGRRRAAVEAGRLAVARGALGRVWVRRCSTA
jgi:hypothetical protein